MSQYFSTVVYENGNVEFCLGIPNASRRFKKKVLITFEVIYKTPSIADG